MPSRQLRGLRQDTQRFMSQALVWCAASEVQEHWHALTSPRCDVWVMQHRVRTGLPVHKAAQQMTACGTAHVCTPRRFTAGDQHAPWAALLAAPWAAPRPLPAGRPRRAHRQPAGPPERQGRHPCMISPSEVAHGMPGTGEQATGLCCRAPDAASSCCAEIACNAAQPS